MQYWSSFKEIRIVGGGKAGSAMAKAAEDLLLAMGLPPERITGWVNIPEGGSDIQSSRIKLFPARPPGVNFPTKEVVYGTEQILNLVETADDSTLILALISGGGSALLAAPVPQITLDEKVVVSRLITNSGGDIRDLNTVRKHLSRIKGGGLRMRYQMGKPRGSFWTLIISDVMSDPLDVIASGPTVPDPTTYADAIAVLDRLNLRKKAPNNVIQYLDEGVQGKHAETMKKFEDSGSSETRIIANCEMAIGAASKHAESLGFQVVNLGLFEGDTLEVADRLARDCHARAGSNRPLCVLSGGETTVKLTPESGKGGRNQSMALALLTHFRSEHLQHSCILCAGTDGEDGPTDAAGAFADFDTWKQSLTLGLDPQTYLAKHDAYHFFDQTNSLFKTGLTQTNVMDLRVLLIAASE